ncbi:MAG: SCO family protein [Acetobacteraceae bacterium]
MGAGTGSAGAQGTFVRARFGRRALLATGSGVVLLPLLGSRARAAEGSSEGRTVDVTGWSLPRLAFTMADADTAREVSAADFRGQVVLLYFGFTNCTDVCPMTLHNIALALRRLGQDAGERVRALFVTVDPDRDTIAVLHKYTHAFAPEIVGLRGTANQLAALASRYHIGYSVSPATATRPYDVNHSSVIYVFDAHGRARFLIPSLDSSTSDVAGLAGVIRHLLGPGSPEAGAPETVAAARHT